MSGSLVAIDADSTGARRLTLLRVDPPGRRVAERFVVPGSDNASYPRVASDHTSQIAWVTWTQGERGRGQLKLVRWNAGR